ncbi:MAG: autotransporter outer membrane beta-barrel domain-containing protein [Alphaproteobacteria bacterium]|nr:autotransporter outer membrane beta-barrel domain-containing protein [Alphaproteobacteria bacterium]MCL2505288.1 autotransporter outer membrane beta-barrel domain-containing protein [Alphaproteobacteria bacterium]
MAFSKISGLAMSTAALIGSINIAYAANVATFSELETALTTGDTSITLTDNITFTASIPNTGAGSWQQAAAAYSIFGDGFVLDGGGLFNDLVIRNDPSVAKTITIGDGLTFSNFYRTTGGAAIWTGGGSSGSPPVYNPASLVIGNRVTFDNNHSTATGGAIAFSTTGVANSLLLTIGTNSYFYNNNTLAGVGGGAISIYNTSNQGGSVISIGDNATFDTNTVSTTGTGYGGGAIYKDFYNASATSNADSTLTIASGTTFSNNESSGTGGAIYSRIYSIATGTDINTMNIGDNVEFSTNTAGGLGGAINFQVHNTQASGTAQATMNITTTGGTTLFTGNTDSSGNNDIYLNGTANATLNININGAAGETVFEGGLANAAAIGATTAINKTNGGILTFGANALNTNFTGTFNASGGTTTFYGQFFENALGNNYSNSTLNLWQNTAAVNLGILSLNNMAVNTINNQVNTFSIASLTAAGVNNFFIDLDGAAFTSDLFNITTGSGSGTLNVSSFNAFNSPTAETFDVQVFGGDIGGYGFTTTQTILDSGAYEYTITSLQNEGQPGYYRFNQGGESNIGKTIANMPALHLSVVKTGMNELRKRLGDLRSESGGNGAGLWARAYGKHLNVDEKISARMNLGGMEAGIDAEIPIEQGRLYVGAMGGYMHAGNIRIDQDNEFDGSGHGNVPSAGLYATWFNDSGWFADATMRHFWVMMDMKNILASGKPITFDARRNFITGSLEAGKALYYDAPAWAQSYANESQFLIEPKAELQYAYAGKKQTVTSATSVIQYNTTQSLLTSFRVQAAYLPEGKKSKIKPFVELGVYNEWLGKTNIKFAGANMKSDVSGVGGEVSVGLNAQLTDNAYMYGDVSYEKGSVYEGVSGNVGVRVRF